MEKNKIKVFESRIKEFENKIESIDKRLNNIIKKNKKHHIYLCNKCGGQFNDNEDLCNHNCKLKRYDYLHKNKLFWSLVINNHNNNIDLRDVRIICEDSRNTKYGLIQRLKRLEIHIQTISIKCQCCKKSNLYIENCGCDFNHLLCETCCDDTNDKCPICSQIINFEMCPICMCYKHEQIEVNCGNNHKICKDCLQNIINISDRPRCPFCRIRI